MNKLILLALSIGALSNTNNVSTNTNTMYAYGLPYQMNNTMELVIDNSYGYVATNYIPKGSYFNNTMETNAFINSLTVGYTNGDSEHYDDTLGQLYYELTNLNENMAIDIYGGAIINGYVDTNGFYVDLSYSDTSFIGLSLFNLWSGNEYTYTMDYSNNSNPYLNHITLTSEGDYNFVSTTLTLNFLRNAKQVYVGGFYAVSGDYETRTKLNFFLQYALSLMYGNDILDDLESNYLTSEYFFSDGRFTNYQVDYSLNAFYPYMYLGLNSIDTLYYLQNYGYAIDEVNNKFYSPNNTVIYNGWFKYNNAYYDTLFLNFTMIGNGMGENNVVTLNGQTFNLTTPQLLYVFNGLYAFNSRVNTLTKILSSNLTEVGAHSYTVSNQYILNHNTNLITFYNVYFYGTNYKIDFYSSRWDANYADAHWPELLIENLLLQDYLINVVHYRNYLDCLYLKPLGAGDNLGNATGSIVTGSTATLSNVFDLFGGALNSLTGFLNFAIFPGITLGLLLLVPLIITLIITIVKLFKR